MKTRIIFFLLIITGLSFSSCVKDELYKGPPVLSDLSINPQAPGNNDLVTVSVKATDLNGIKAVTLYYKVDQGAFTSLSMSAIAGQASMYSAQIPAQETGKTVSYYVGAENESGQKAWIPTGAPATTAAYTVGAPSIVMNEIYSRGNVDEPDWIEIYNNSDSQADISGYKIYDTGGQTGGKPKKAIPAGTVIPARGFYVIVVDDGSESGFGLSSAGEEVWFENASGNVIDNIVFPALEPSQSFGRMPDGTGGWAILNKITKGSANNDTPAATVILMNEIFSKGADPDFDWIEIFNGSAVAVDISGYKIYDSGGQAGTKPKKELPSGTIIPAGGFYVIVVDDAEASGFGLSGNGEQVWLEKADGTVIDDITFPAMVDGQSYGRKPDGSANFFIFTEITRGTSNNNATTLPKRKK
jgi:hypothetical protein